MNTLAHRTQEQKLIEDIFGIVAKFEYKPGDKMDKVLLLEDGTVRLVTSELNTDRLGIVYIYHIYFDPINKNGILFSQYLENVEIHLVGVNRNDGDAPDYRECTIELKVRDPTTMTTDVKRFILKTDKSSGISRFGVPWLEKQSFLTTTQALAVVEVIYKALDHKWQSDR